MLAERDPAGPVVTYLTVDGLGAGVGASQVLPYVEALGRHGVVVRLHSFEPSAPGPDLRARLEAAGVEWHTHSFGRAGSLGGLGRVARGVWYLRGAALVHARGDLAGLAASVRSSRPFVWDMRGFWVDERIALGLVRPGSLVERVLRRVERRLAQRSRRIITLSRAATRELASRHGPAVAGKAAVVPTCVDLEAFASTPVPINPTVAMFAGSLSVRYDVPRMVQFVDGLRAHREVVFDVVTPGATPWAPELAAAGAVMSSARPAEMPAVVQRGSLCLSMLRPDASTESATVPTKIAEFLASGRPVVVNAGLGDLDELIDEYSCGVVVGPDDAGIDAAAARVDSLLSDPETPARCRRAAVARFDLQTAVAELAALYRAID